MLIEATESAEALAATLGCRVGHLPTTYICLSLGASFNEGLG